MCCEEKPVRKLSGSIVTHQEAILTVQLRNDAGVNKDGSHMDAEAGPQSKYLEGRIRRWHGRRWVWWLMPVISAPVLGRLSQENYQELRPA